MIKVNFNSLITSVSILGIVFMFAGQVSGEAVEMSEERAKAEVLQVQLDHVAKAMEAVESASVAVGKGSDDDVRKELEKVKEHLLAIQNWMVQMGGRELPLALGEKAPDFTLYTLDRKAVQLSKQIADGPVVIIVLRGWPGYQCPVCTRQIGQFISQAGEFIEAGVDVVLLYPGPGEHLAEHAEQFISGKSLPEGFHFVTDPNYIFTERYGLRWDAPKETAYPSTFVVDQNGLVRFAKVSKTHGGRAEVSEVLKAIAEIKQEKSGESITSPQD